MDSNRTKERIGINAVSRTVEVDWASGWQEYEAQNDDAVDGIILMRKGRDNPTDTGGVVFVQVKCGGNGYRSDQRQYPDHLCIALGEQYIRNHQPRWNRLPGPVVLIFVDDTIDKRLPPAWWVNLRDPNCISPSNGGNILIPKSQRFGHHAKGMFHSLCGPGPADRRLKTISLSRQQLVPIRLGSSESLRNDAWEFYKEWRHDDTSRFHSELGEILVNRVGWKHLTRKGRSPERIIHSWLLLGAAREMVRQDANALYLGHAKVTTVSGGLTKIVDYLGLKANIVFPHRHQSMVQVVLKRQRLLNTKYRGAGAEKLWFYSVFEPRRGMELS